MSGYDVEKLEALLAQATRMPGILEVWVNAPAAPGSTLVGSGEYIGRRENYDLLSSAISALPAMLHDLKLLAAAREQSIEGTSPLEWAIAAIEYASGTGRHAAEKGHTLEPIDLALPALRTLAAPPTEEEKCVE